VSLNTLNPLSSAPIKAHKRIFYPNLPKKKKQGIKASNPLINGKRPALKEDTVLYPTPESEDSIEEVEILLNDDTTSTLKIRVKKLNKPLIGRPPILSDKREEIVAKYEAGASLKELAKLYRVSVPCMADTVRRGGGKTRGRGRPSKKKEK
jgi:hypothetical protein